MMLKQRPTTQFYQQEQVTPNAGPNGRLTDLETGVEENYVSSEGTGDVFAEGSAGKPQTIMTDGSYDYLPESTPEEFASKQADIAALSGLSGVSNRTSDQESTVKELTGFINGRIKNSKNKAFETLKNIDEYDIDNALLFAVREVASQRAEKNADGIYEVKPEANLIINSLANFIHRSWNTKVAGGLTKDQAREQAAILMHQARFDDKFNALMLFDTAIDNKTKKSKKRVFPVGKGGDILKQYREIFNTVPNPPSHNRATFSPHRKLTRNPDGSVNVPEGSLATDYITAGRANLVSANKAGEADLLPVIDNLESMEMESTYGWVQDDNAIGILNHLNASKLSPGTDKALPTTLTEEGKKRLKSHKMLAKDFTEEDRLYSRTKGVILSILKK